MISSLLIDLLISVLGSLIATFITICIKRLLNMKKTAIGSDDFLHK